MLADERALQNFRDGTCAHFEDSVGQSELLFHPAPTSPKPQSNMNHLIVTAMQIYWLVFVANLNPEPPEKRDPQLRHR